VSLVSLVSSGRSLVIEIRGRIISWQHYTRQYMVTDERSLMMWDAFHHPVASS
jgi:hypothetical protein